MLETIYKLASIFGFPLSIITLVYTVNNNIKNSKKQLQREEILKHENDLLNSQREELIKRDEALMRDKRYFRIKEKKELLSVSAVYFDIKYKKVITLLERETPICSKEIEDAELDLDEGLQLLVNSFEAFWDEIDHFCLRYYDWIVNNDSDKLLVKEIRDSMIKFVELFDEIHSNIQDSFRQINGRRSPNYKIQTYTNYYKVLNTL